MNALKLILNRFLPALPVLAVIFLGGAALAQNNPVPPGFLENAEDLISGLEAGHAEAVQAGAISYEIRPDANFENGILAGLAFDSDLGDLVYYLNAALIAEQYWDEFWDRVLGVPRFADPVAFWTTIGRYPVLHEHLHACCNNGTSLDGSDGILDCEHLTIDSHVHSDACDEVTNCDIALFAAVQAGNQAEIDRLLAKIAALCAVAKELEEKWNSDEGKQAACACYPPPTHPSTGFGRWCCPGLAPPPVPGAWSCPSDMCVPATPGGATPPPCLGNNVLTHCSPCH